MRSPTGLLISYSDKSAQRSCDCLANRAKRWSGAFVCIFNPSFTKILLLNRKNSKEWEWKGDWGSIGGSVEQGETPLHACVREAREEIGATLNPKRLIPVHVKRRSFPHPHPYVVHFYATSIKESARIRLNDESYKYGWFDIKSIPDRTLDSKSDILRWRDIANEKAKRYGVLIEDMA